MNNKGAYVWGLIGRFAPQVIYLLTTIVLARFLSPDDFGKIGVLSIIFIVAGVLLDAGLGGSLIKEKEISKVDCSSIAFFNISVSIVIYIILFIFSNKVEAYFDIEGLSSVLRCISLVFPITAFGIVPRAILNRNLSFKTTSSNAVVAVIIASLVSILLGYFRCGVYALVAYQLINNFVIVLLNSIAIKYRPSFKVSMDSLKRLIPFGAFTTLITVVETVYENIMTTLTGKYMNVEQAGYLFQAKKLEESLSQSIATTIGSVSFPVLTKLKDDTSAFIKEALSTYITISLLLFPILITVSIFSDEIIYILYGANWASAAPYLKALMIAGIFMVLESLLRIFVKSLCEVKKLLYVTLIKRALGIAIIITSLLWNPQYMILGYIASAVVGFIFNYFLYISVSQCNSRDLLISTLKSLLPCALYFILFGILLNECSVYVKLSASIIVWASYYFLYLPKEGINLLTYLSNLVKR